MFAGVFDVLAQGKPHGLRSLSFRKLSEAVEALKTQDKVMQKDREAMYAMRKELHSRGITTYLLPWGIVSDKGGPADITRNELRNQVEAIKRAFDDIKNV